MDYTSTGAAPVKTGKADRRADLPFLVITLTLLGVGVVMVLSASFASAYYDLQGETGHNPVYFFSRQASAFRVHWKYMPSFRVLDRADFVTTMAVFLMLFLFIAIVCFAAVLVIGTVVNGARRWISLGFTTFQPSEITKIAIILYFSALICKYKDRMRTFRYGIAPFAAILAVVSALLVLEPHFSATIIILAIGASMLFLGGVRLHWFIGAAGVLLVGAVAAVLFVLLRPNTDSSLSTEESAPMPETAATPVPEAEDAQGELNWQYPPGWVDYSDLPDKETLGDEEQPGLSNWRYLLVNGLSQENYLRENYYPDMVEIENGYFFQRRAADALKEFLAAARAQGFTVSISRTYMSYPDQRTRFNGMASTLYDQGDISLADAEKKVTEMGYYPGADEHQTGLAVNFVGEDAEAKFSTPVLEWMREHCAEYGFILRYPEGREEYTGRDPEPGHFRYVGEVAAEYIMRKGITLEEFKDAYDESKNDPWAKKDDK